MIETGSPAPDFELPGTDARTEESGITRYRLSDYLDDGPVILTFYLFDFNPKCTNHMCSLRDLEWFNFLENTTIFAISTDRVFSHQAFAEDQQLDFTLLSDSDGSVSEAYDVLYDEFNHHKRVAKRSVFVIDESGTIQYAWATDDPEEMPDWSAVHEAVQPLATIA
ncbi:MAG: redoxin domain-containing protein [Halobacteriales archaeon]|nr:redoxin domain-containing protein [Halobacteriales archaeon]